jgi:hypothetical protein
LDEAQLCERTRQVFCCLGFTGAEGSFGSTAILELHRDEKGSLTAFSKWSHDQPGTVPEVLEAVIVLKLKDVEHYLNLLRVFACLDIRSLHVCVVFDRALEPSGR